jgi:hypothetical protein
VIVAVAVMLAADVLKRVADAVTNASAVMAADASSVLPANELKGAWEKLAMPNIYCSLFVCWFWRIALFNPILKRWVIFCAS